MPKKRSDGNTTLLYLLVAAGLLVVFLPKITDVLRPSNGNGENGNGDGDGETDLPPGAVLTDLGVWYDFPNTLGIPNVSEETIAAATQLPWEFVDPEVIVGLTAAAGQGAWYSGAAQFALPLFLGLSPTGPEAVGATQYLLESVLGIPTSEERGNLTLISSRGPFIWNAVEGACFNINGTRFTCPDPSMIVGGDPGQAAMYEHWFDKTKGGTA